MKNGFDEKEIKQCLVEQVDSADLDIEGSYNLFLNKVTDCKKVKLTYLANIRKTMAIAACLVICVTSIVVASSSTVRAMAQNTIDSIISLFVVERTGENSQIVQKPITEIKSEIQSVEATTLSDEELSKRIGFSITFSQNITDDVTLISKYTGVLLNSKVPYSKQYELLPIMQRAVYDDDTMNSLSEYSPVRYIGALYRYQDYGIVITANISTENIDISSYTEKIGDMPAMWGKNKYPIYPRLEDNGVIKGDMTQKPTLSDCVCLSWIYNSVSYKLQQNGTSLTKEKAIEIANAFMKQQ